MAALNSLTHVRHRFTGDSTISVFERGPDGTIRHTYSTHPRLSEDIKGRGIDLLTPVYNILDLTPEGRGDLYAKLAYR